MLAASWHGRGLVNQRKELCRLLIPPHHSPGNGGFMMMHVPLDGGREEVGNGLTSQ